MFALRFIRNLINAIQKVYAGFHVFKIDRSSLHAHRFIYLNSMLIFFSCLLFSVSFFTINFERLAFQVGGG